MKYGGCLLYILIVTAFLWFMSLAWMMTQG